MARNSRSTDKGLSDHDFATQAREALGAESNDDALAAIQKQQDSTAADGSSQGEQQSARGGANDPQQAENMGENVNKDASKQSVEAQQAAQEKQQ